MNKFAPKKREAEIGFNYQHDEIEKKKYPSSNASSVMIGLWKKWTDMVIIIN